MADEWRGVGAVVAEIEARAEADGWDIAPWPGALLVDGEFVAAPSTYAPQCVAVEAAVSSWQDGDRGYTRRANRGALRTSTTVLVHWVYAVATDDGSHPYRAALDAEASLIGRVIRPTGQPMQVLVDSAQRQITPEGWVVGRIQVTVSHHMPLPVE